MNDFVNISVKDLLTLCNGNYKLDIIDIYQHNLFEPLYSGTTRDKIDIGILHRRVEKFECYTLDHNDQLYIDIYVR